MKYLILLAAMGLTACQPTSTTTSTNAQAASVQAAPTAGVMSLLNGYRAGQGLPPLRENARLSRASRKHAQDMVVNNFFAHVGSDRSTFVDRAKSAGYDCVASENIAWGQSSEPAVMTAWMNSPPHRRNIMLTDTEEFGIGRFENHWVMMFGRGC